MVDREFSRNAVSTAPWRQHHAVKEEKTMRTLALFSSLMATLLVASTGSAAPPSRFTFTFDETFPSMLTFACGFPVFVHVEGNATATLFFDRSGTLLREIDTQPGFKVTFFAPSTGKSFTYPSAGAFIQDYSNGTDLGSPVIATVTGLLNGTGSTPPDAGRVVMNAVIVGFTPEGIPIIDPVSDISRTGHFNDDLVAARCATLSDP
jgi:hypothetical protein